VQNVVAQKIFIFTYSYRLYTAWIVSFFLVTSSSYAESMSYRITIEPSACDPVSYFMHAISHNMLFVDVVPKLPVYQLTFLRIQLN